MWKNILPCVHGWMIFMDLKMDELYSKCGQQMLFLRKFVQKIGLKQFMLVFFKTNPQMKCSSHNLKPYFIFP